MATDTPAGLRRPYTVALTGGIASGKTLVSDCFAELGAGVIDTDLLAREVVATGSAGLSEIAACFGTEIIADNGELDRAKLRRIVFSDAAARGRLEAITHPRIRDLAASKLAAVTQPYAVLVIPLLVESLNNYKWVDRILVVDVSPATQRARLLQRDQVDVRLADAMIAAQASRQQRLAIADDILTNEGSIEQLRKGVTSLDSQYRLAALHAPGDAEPERA